MKKSLNIIIINIALLAAFFALQVVSAVIVAPLQAGLAAETWAGQSGERFAQLAVFFPPTYGFDEKAISDTRKSLDSSLLAVSMENSDERRLYADAWTAESTVSVSGGRGSVSKVPVIGVGGDYFLFHPMYLRSGNYISQNDLMRDLVVLDEELAWRLFGSVQLAGMEVKINNRPFLIAGVVAREEGAAYARAMSVDGSLEESGGLFMSFDALRDMPLAEDETKISITSYELVMPDVVTNFAVDSLEKAIDDEDITIIDNTSRFSYANLFNLIGSYGERSMRSEAVSYPYWENAVRYAEDWLALLLFASILLMICPLVFAVIYAIKLIRFTARKIKDKVIAVLKEHEKRAYRRYISGQGRRVQKQNTL